MVQEPTPSLEPQPSASYVGALPVAARWYVVLITVCGALGLAGVFPFRVEHPVLFIALLAFSVITSTWKVTLPAAIGSGSTLSVSCAADLMALLLLGTGPAMVVAITGVLTQCTLFAKQRYPLYRTVFSMGAESITMRATAAAYATFGGARVPLVFTDLAQPIVVSIIVYYLVNTLLIAGAIALSTRERLADVWRDNFLWAAPSFMVAGSAGAFAAVLVASGHHWMAVVLAAPIYLTFRSYRLFLDSMRALVQARAAEQALAAEKERLSVVLAGIGDGVVAADGNRHVTLLNRAAEALTGWSQADALGRPLADIYRPLQPGTRVPLEDPPMPQPDESRASRRALLVARDGRERPIDEVVAPLYDAAGAPTGIVFAFRDITDSIRMQEEQERTGRLSSLGVLAGGIAHDFNNILSAILGNVSVVRSTRQLDSESTAALVQAEQACLRARQLTQQLLTFAKGGEPIKKPIDLGRLIRESSKLALSGSSIRCHSDIDPGLWAVDADEGQIVQVLHNLLVNARQAMNDSGVVEIAARNFPEPEARWDRGLLVKPGPYVTVSVTDHGGGIPDDVLGRIFEPYFTTKPKGSGLGLATVYSIVSSHGGFVTVDSAVGRGTTVHVRLPALLSGVQEERVERRPEEGIGQGRVLVLDDEDAIRLVVSKMLRSLGYEPETASEGHEAIARYEEARAAGRPFDTVIVDLTIPGGIGGKDVLRELMRIDPDVKAIVASGYADDAAMARFREHGFKAMVAKPFTLGELRHALADVLVRG
jgi:PAS domain S-box-containing protein